MTNRPIKGEDAGYVRRSQCGFEGALPKVCCPLKANPVNITTMRNPDINTYATGKIFQQFYVDDSFIFLLSQ